MKRRPVTYVDGIPVESGERGDMTAAVFWYGGKFLLLVLGLLGLVKITEIIGKVLGL